MDEGAGGSYALGSYAAVFAPVAGARRSEAVARRLRDSITLGLLPDASPLPAEADLADRFGVATTTVREALAELRGEGLIRTRRGRGGGSFIRAPRDGGRAALLGLLAETGLGELRDAMDHYAAISGTCARLAALRADPSDVARLRRRTEPPGAGSGASPLRVEGRFHLDLAASAQSARLTREEMKLQGEVGPVLWLAHALRGSAAVAGARHTAIIDAIERGEAEAARVEAEAHVAELFGAVRELHHEARRRA